MPALPKKVRKNYRIAPALAKWVKKHAKQSKKTETEVIEEAIFTLRILEEKGKDAL